MATVLERELVKPNPTTLKQLQRIGELTDNLSGVEQELCKALGLSSRLMSFNGQSDAGFWVKDSFRFKTEGFQRLRVTVGTSVRLEAWRQPEDHDEWTIVSYEPGAWEMLCPPSLRLVQWLNEWGGMHTDMQLTFQVAVEDFKRTKEMYLPLRADRRSQLCGRCGEEVQKLAEHINRNHVRAGSPLPLDVYVRNKEGGRLVFFARGKGKLQQVWNISEELYDPRGKDPSYRLGLALDISRVQTLIGKRHLSPRNRRYTLPDDITPLPFLAHVLRTLTL